MPVYPVQERHQLVWFWPGDPDQADPALIPVLDHLDRQDLGHVTGTMPVDAHYELYVDNLMDLTHAQFVPHYRGLVGAWCTDEARRLA